MNYVFKLIDFCKHIDVEYHHQSVVILESTPVGMSTDSTSHFFEGNMVVALLAIERPYNSGQLYIAEGLSRKYHFSCPTQFLPSLVNIIQEANNPKLNLLFIPRSTECFKSEKITVCNDVTIPPTICHKDCTDSLFNDILKVGEKVSGNSIATSGKRSNHSIAIGLQTMYAFQQHSARYSMLPHSMPHVPNVKKLPQSIIRSILTVYSHTMKLLDNIYTSSSHPFAMKGPDVLNQAEMEERHKLRKDFIQHLKQCIGDKSPGTWPSDDIMFEACTVQPTGALGFHKDLMNCSSLDKTIAFIAPICMTESKKTKGNCLTYLFYSRKCVGEHARKIALISQYDADAGSCKLTKLCLRSIMNIGGVFDYQGSLFEADESLERIALRLEGDAEHGCPDIKEFTGLSCFKHGAAFDKMGYYSILLNIFLSLYYKEILKDIDDAIGLCMYFGLLCNGTSALAAVWSSIAENEDGVKKWILKHKCVDTKMFQLLCKLYKKRFGVSKKGGKVLYGCCKLPRYQYANHAPMIIENASTIHGIVKDFITWRTSLGINKRPISQQDYLFKKLKTIKGIGPISFNQFWHSMCLCGILPPGHIQHSTVGPGSGPAKLIQTFYPYIKSADALQKKLGAVTTELNRLGFKKINDFFVENLMCEAWRIANAGRLFKNGMTFDEKSDVFLSDIFKTCVKGSKPTVHADIYYRNPFTDEHQHLFRVVDKELLMRPSCVNNNNTGSVNLQCIITSDIKNGDITVKWSDKKLKAMQKDRPSDLFS